MELITTIYIIYIYIYNYIYILHICIDIDIDILILPVDFVDASFLSVLLHIYFQLVVVILRKY